MDNVFIRKDDVNKWIGKYFPNKELISVDDLIGCIEDLDSEIEELKFNYEDLQNDLEENYEPIHVAKQYEIHDDDFI